MYTLGIKDYIDKYNDYARAGNAACSDVCDKIDANQTIVFDMKGIDAVSTVFLNAFFGQLIDKYGIERIKGAFKFSGLLKSQFERIKKYFVDYAALIDDMSSKD